MESCVICAGVLAGTCNVSQAKDCEIEPAKVQVNVNSNSPTLQRPSCVVRVLYFVAV